MTNHRFRLRSSEAGGLPRASLEPCTNSLSLSVKIYYGTDHFPRA